MIVIGIFLSCENEAIPYYNSENDAVRFSNKNSDGYGGNGIVYQSYSFVSNPLDEYAGEEVKELKNTISDKYSQYVEIKKELDKFDMDETKRLRECEFAEFEINEIEAANLSLGEDDEVENEFKKLSGSEKIMSSLSDAYQIMGYEGNQG